MPWCPHCDEVFPQGPACPRCQSQLVEVTGGNQPEEMQGAVALPRLKVPRRVRRAFGRLSPEPPPSRQLVVFALSLALIAGGFALGRMSSTPVEGPAVRPLAVPAVSVPVGGSLGFVGRVPGPGGTTPSDLTLVRISLRQRTSEHLGRFSSPLGGSSAGRERTRFASLEESVALVLTSTHGDSVVGAFPASRRPVLWLEGHDVAWEGAGTMLALEDDGTVRRWSFSPDAISSEVVPGRWRRVFQAPDGAVLEGVDGRGHFLAASAPDGPRRVLSVPDDANVVAVGPRASRVLLSAEGGTRVWDGATMRAPPLDGGYEVHGAAFSRDGEKVAVVVREPRTGSAPSAVHLAVLDISGALKGLRRLTAWDAGQACTATPAWDGSHSWVFVSVGDGSVYGIEVGGGIPREIVPSQSVGCGVAWSA